MKHFDIDHTNFDTSHSMFTQYDTFHTHFGVVHTLFTSYDTVHKHFDIDHTHTLTQFTHCSQAMTQFTKTLT